MKKCSIFLSSMVAMFLFAGIAKAQPVFMVVDGSGVSTPYATIEEAVAGAAAGSTVYIPTGAFTINANPNIASAQRNNTLLINKPLTLIGAGTDEGALHATVITGNMCLQTAASGSVLEGFALEGNNLGTILLDNISNVTIKRCRINAGVNLSGKGDGNIIRECIFGWISSSQTLYGNGGLNADPAIFTQIIVQNNIIGNIISFLREAIFSNNVFTYGNNQMLQYIENTLVFNNIFIYGVQTDYGGAATHHNVYTYNVNVGTFTTPAPSNYITVDNNLENVALYDIFGTNTPANTRWKLAADSPGKDFGSDGTDVGIYGGSLPAKEYRLPSVPEVTQFSVAGASNPDGTLKVNIKVEAQDE